MYLREVVRPSLPVVPCGGASAPWHGGARAVLGRNGLSTPVADGQIAAIAGADGLTVVTEATSDYDPFPELDEGIHVENWCSA